MNLDSHQEVEVPSNSGATKIKTTRTRAADVLAKLRNDISQCYLLPGQRLHLEELSQRYGVGYSPIREALSRLAADGLVILAEYKGYRVAPISREDWLDILMLRQDFESKGLALSMTHAQEGWREYVKQCFVALAAQDAYMPDGSTMNPEWEHCHHAFHRALIAGCKSPWLQRFSGTLVEQSNRYLRSGLSAHLLVEDRDHLKEHQAIVAAIDENDVDLATALLRSHFGRTSKMLSMASSQLFVETFNKKTFE